MRRSILLLLLLSLLILGFSTKEAIELVTKSNEATIDVSNYPKVILGGC
ncbi:hypothetical protein [Aequorivita sp. KMM 9714]|nr:hypothetical protein [Aequorivita sp. KMM 9714]NGX84506.1 hypothetical protein [Aequorivita sp. KMM 9714]